MKRALIGLTLALFLTASAFPSSHHSSAQHSATSGTHHRSTSATHHHNYYTNSSGHRRAHTDSRQLCTGRSNRNVWRRHVQLQRRSGPLGACELGPHRAYGRFCLRSGFLLSMDNVQACPHRGHLDSKTTEPMTCAIPISFPQPRFEQRSSRRTASEELMRARLHERE